MANVRAHGDRKKQFQDPGKAKVGERSGGSRGSASKHFGGAKILPEGEFPFNEATDAGPFQNWPLGKGFDRFYGFMEGYTDQYTPDLVKDNERIRAPKTPEEGYHLSEDLAEQAIRLVNRQHMVYPDNPFFLYFALGAGLVRAIRRMDSIWNQPGIS